MVRYSLIRLQAQQLVNHNLYHFSLERHTLSYQSIAVDYRLNSLTITLELHRIATQPSRIVGTTLDAIGTVSGLAQTTSLASRRGQTTHLTMFVNRIADPLDTRVVANLGMGGIDEDDFVVLHGGVLIDPVRVENAEIGVLASNLFFSHRLQVALKLELVDTLVLGFTKNHT